MWTLDGRPLIKGGLVTVEQGVPLFQSIAQKTTFMSAKGRSMIMVSPMRVMRNLYVDVVKCGVLLVQQALDTMTLDRHVSQLHSSLDA